MRACTQASCQFIEFLLCTRLCSSALSSSVGWHLEFILELGQQQCRKDQHMEFVLELGQQDGKEHVQVVEIGS